MGNRSSTAVTSKHNEHGSGHSLKYGFASMQGFQYKMENAHRAVTGLSDDLKDWSFFGVFAGHSCDRSGSGDSIKVSAYCAEHLMEYIVNSEDFRKSDFTSGIRSGFLHLDDSMRSVPKTCTGATAVCAFVSPKQIFLANCGDSRAVLCNSGVPTFKTQDHKPELKTEKERIRRAGGHIYDGNVQDKLAITRALGYYKFKNEKELGPCEQIISPEPEVLVIDRDEKDEFLVIASKSIWESMSNKAVCNFIRSRLLVTDDLEAITNQVLDICLCQRSEDNMSIILVTFPAAPTPSPEAIEKEKNLKRDIESRIIKMISVTDDDEVSFEKVMEKMKKQEKYLPDLLTGDGSGYIGAKRSFIESIFQQCCDRAYELRVITNQVLDALLHENGSDTASIALVPFPAAPTTSLETIKKEDELEQVIKRRILSMIVTTDRDNVSFEQVLDKLKETDLSELTPCSDSDTKRTFIEIIFELCRDRADTLRVITDQSLSEEAKQNAWIESIQAVRNNSNLSEPERNLIEKLSKYRERAIPRTPKKFLCFAYNNLSCKNKWTNYAVFNLIYDEWYRSSKAANSKNNQTRKKESDDLQQPDESEDVRSDDKSTEMDDDESENVENENIVSEVETSGGGGYCTIGK